LETNELTDLEQAEKDLRFYAAIIGHRPTMDAMVAAKVGEPPQPEPPRLRLAVDQDPISLKPDKPHALKIWMRHLSHRARTRLDEAYHRMAS